MDNEWLNSLLWKSDQKPENPISHFQNYDIRTVTRSVSCTTQSSFFNNSRVRSLVPIPQVRVNGIKDEKIQVEYNIMYANLLEQQEYTNTRFSLFSKTRLNRYKTGSSKKLNSFP